jgi:1,4-dihydroxy-2-naphthoate octaprenyltransferase
LKPSKLKLYLLEMRAPFFTATIVPVALGGAVAWARQGQFHVGYFVLTLLAGILLHAGINISNDYFDHLSGDDEANTEFVRPFTGGSRMIQEGLLTPGEVLAEAFILLGGGCLVGLVLFWTRGPWILALGLVGVLSGFFYTAPPLRLVSRGFGELFIGLDFGILVVLGSYYVQTQSLAWEPVVAAVPVALLISAVLYINEFQDCAADRSVGKNHWVARLGKRRGVWLYLAMMVLTYVAIIVPVLGGWLPTFSLLGLLTIPLAWKAVSVLREHYERSLELAPANASTILIHLATGVLLILAYVADKLASAIRWA